MHSTRVRWISSYGAALALLVAISTLGFSSDIGGGNVAFAQGNGQPGADDEEDGDTGEGQMPNQTPGMASETTPGPPQQSGTQRLPDLVFTAPQGPGPQSGFLQSGPIDEGGDIDEGLSNQRIDPDD
jgi:hypothetical protein